MASHTELRRGTISAEHRFFMISAWVMAAVIVAGFSTSLLLGRSTFAVPSIFHVHAFFFFGWVALYVTQTSLVAGNNVALHRRLGWLAVGWVPIMLVLASAVTIVSVRAHGGPPFFDTNEFLFQNIVGIVFFAAMAGAAIAMRRRTAWHRRLMFWAMASLTGPGLGRLLPAPFFIPWAWWVIQSFAALFPIAGMIFDYRRNGRVHPAWWWGLALFFGTQILCDIVAYSPPGYALTRAVLAGSANGRADMRAHFP